MPIDRRVSDLSSNEINQIVMLYHTNGMSVQDISKQMDISEKIIWIVLTGRDTPFQ